jgi:hypothetical protein
LSEARPKRLSVTMLTLQLRGISDAGCSASPPKTGVPENWSGITE